MLMKLMKHNKGWRPLGRLFASWISGLIPYRHRYCTYLYYSRVKGKKSKEKNKRICARVSLTLSPNGAHTRVKEKRVRKKTCMCACLLLFHETVHTHTQRTHAGRQVRSHTEKKKTHDNPRGKNARPPPLPLPSHPLSPPSFPPPRPPPFPPPPPPAPLDEMVDIPRTFYKSKRDLL